MQNEELLTQINNKIKDCTLCPLGIPSAGKPTFGIGFPAAPLMILGEAPGHEESLVGKPFVGKSGKLLQKLLQEANYSFSDIYVTNSVKHRPPENRNPTQTELATCSHYLKKEIEIVNPKIILTVGLVPTRTMAVLSGVNRLKSPVRGFSFFYKTHQVIATYHPAYCLRNPLAIKLLLEDLIKIKELL